MGKRGSKVTISARVAEFLHNVNIGEATFAGLDEAATTKAIQGDPSFFHEVALVFSEIEKALRAELDNEERKRNGDGALRRFVSEFYDKHPARRKGWNIACIWGTPRKQDISAITKFILKTGYEPQISQVQHQTNTPYKCVRSALVRLSKKDFLEAPWKVDE